jgi:hypothetical protein
MDTLTSLGAPKLFSESSHHLTPPQHFISEFERLPVSLVKGSAELQWLTKRIADIPAKMIILALAFSTCKERPH